METVWKFEIGRVRVLLNIEPEHGYQYDGHDPKKKIQSKLDSGEYVAFGSIVTVEMDGETIGEDSLWGSVYSLGTIAEFWTAHRDRNPMNRNCSIMRANHPAGPKVSICHYFPDMVREAIREARIMLNSKKAA